MKLIKSIFALAAAVFLGTSAQAATTTLNGQTITYTGTASVTGSDTTYREIKWTSGTGTLVLPANAKADITVVGGGGSGAGGRYSSNKASYGKGGNGGQVIILSGQDLTATTYDIGVGTGGTAPNSDTVGNAGKDSSFIGGSVSKTALGGAGASDKRLSSPAAGSAGDGATGDYGKAGPASAAQAQQRYTPSAGAANTGSGGQGGGVTYANKAYSATGGGAGGSGVVIAKITYIDPPKPEVTLDGVVLTSGESMTVTADCEDSIVISTTSDKTDVATVSDATISEGVLSIPVTGVDAGVATITVETDKTIYTLSVTVKGIDPEAQTIDLMASDTAAPITTYASALKWWIKRNDVANERLDITVERLVDATAKVTISANGTDATEEPAVIELWADDVLLETITVNILAKEDKAEFIQGVAIDSTWTYVTVATGDTWEFVPNGESYYTDLSRIAGYFIPSIARNEDGTATVSIFGIAPADGKDLVMDVKCDGKVISTIHVVIDPAVVDVAVPIGEGVVVTGKYASTSDANKRHWVFNDTTAKGVVGLSMKKGSGSSFTVSNFTAPAGYEEYNKQTDWDQTFVATMTGSKIGADTVYIGRFYDGKNFVSKCYEYHVKVYEEKTDAIELEAGWPAYPTFTSEVAGAWEATSSDPSIVSIDEAGEVSTTFEPEIWGLKKGTATLTVKNNYCVYTVTVNVTKGTETESFSAPISDEAVEKEIVGGYSAESDDEDVATIDLSDGGTKAKITCKGPGVACCMVYDESEEMIYQFNVTVYEQVYSAQTVATGAYMDIPCDSLYAAKWTAKSSDPAVVEVVNAEGEESETFTLKIKGVAEGTAQVIVKNDYVEYTFDVAVEDLTPVDVPTAVGGLTYNGNEQTGVVASVGFTLVNNTAKDAGNYTATATLEDGYIWADGSSDPTNINWSIGYAQVTVTAYDEDKLVGAEDPEFEATVRGLFGGDKIDYKVARTNTSEVVGTYDLVVTGAARQGNYDVVCVNGTFEIRAGKITVNGKGYDDIPEAIDKLKQDGGRAVCNDDIDWDEEDIKFSNGTVLEYDNQEYIFTVTGNMTVPKVTADKDKVIVVNGTLTLNGDLYANDKGGANVDAEEVVLGGDVTVGKVKEDEETDEIAVLAFDEIDVNGHKLTLTENGVVQSAKSLDIDSVFAEVEHYEVVKTSIVGGFEYTLEPKEFKVNYYDGEDVVHTDTATIKTYENLKIWDGEREGLEFVEYTKENGELLEKSDAALHAYIKEEAENPGCDGEVKVLGTWKKSNITITIEADEETIAEVWYGEERVANDDLELPADATEVTLTLKANVGLTVPVFKVVRGNETNVTTKVATYDIKDGDTLEFFAEEAEWTDPDVTEKQVKDAIIDAIDPPVGPDDQERYDKAVAKVNAVVDTSDEPAPNKVSAKEMAAWITDNTISSANMADSDYVAASVKLDTSAPITDEAEVKFVEVEEDTSTGFTFDFELKLSGKETPEELEVEAKKLVGYIQTTGDLGDGFETTVDPDRVTIDSDTGKVTITPDPAKSAEFFKIVIPQDPGVK